LTRERIIVDIEGLEQAAKVEETVKSGYCDTIQDDLTYWIAAEEDIVDSYTRLAGSGAPESVKSLQDLIADSKDTVSELRELLKSFESLGRRRTSRISRIRELEKSVR